MQRVDSNAQSCSHLSSSRLSFEIIFLIVKRNDSPQCCEHTDYGLGAPEKGMMGD